MMYVDIGLKSYPIVEGGAPLVFNPKDPSVYGRYQAALGEIEALEKETTEKANAVKDGDYAASLGILMEADRKMKAILSRIFGCGNDFDAILRGVGLMGEASNGKLVISNVMDFLNELLVDGAKEYAKSEVEKAKEAREQRREESV